MSKDRNSYDKDMLCNTSDIYKNDEAWEKDFKRIQKDLNKYEHYKTHILDSPNTLYELMDFDTKINRTLSKLVCYAQINYDIDTSIERYQAMWSRIQELIDMYSEKTSYIVPELLEKDYKIIEKYINSEPRLKEYENYLSKTFRMKNHTLSQEEERIIAIFGNSLSTPIETYQFLSDTDLKFGVVLDDSGKKVELTEKSYNKLVTSSNKSVRKNAFERLYETYGKFSNTFAKLLGSEVTNKNRLANLRGFAGLREESLYIDEIPLEIYDNLIKITHKNIFRLKKYWTLRKEALGLKELHLYDLRVDLIDKVNQVYTKEEAEDLIVKALNPLGEEYSEILKKAFRERWIDIADNDNKRNGAYCTTCYDVHPFVLSSFDNTLESVFALTHELGHAVHEYYSSKNQKYQNSYPSIFVAEVASQINEIFLNMYLIQNSKDEKFKINLLDKLIANFRNAVYHQTMFAEFEKNIHDLDRKGISLTKETLNEECYKLNKEYFCDEICVDDVIKYEWARIPHFYNEFYVYQYATSYIAAVILSKNIQEGKKGTKDKYLDFLKLGSSKSPIDSLKIAGVDMEDSKVLKDAFCYFEDLIDELEKKLRCKNG